MESNNQKEEIVTLYLYPDQVSGKEPKLLTSDLSKILKGYNSVEYSFYQTISQQHSPLFLRKIAQFTPKFYGKLQLNFQPHLQIGEQGNTEWLTHLASRYKVRNESNGFTILENLTYLYKYPCIFDIKIGGRNLQGKTHKITQSVSKYFIKLNGCKTWNQQHLKSLLFSKYFLAEITEFEQMCKYIGLYFSHKNKILVQTIQLIIQRLKLLINSFRQIRGYRFISTSICLIYDANKQTTTDVRLIDFGRLITQNPQFQDIQSIQGCENILSILQQLINRKQYYQSFLIQLQQKCTQAEIGYIPQRKLLKKNNKQQHLESDYIHP